MGKAEIDRVAEALAKARTDRERGRQLERDALDEIGRLARDGLAERMTRVEIARHAGITRPTLDRLLARKP